MEVTVRLFAMFREAAGTSELKWEIETGATVGDVWRELHAAYPDMPKVQPAAAINADYARLDEALEAGDEVAFLPPVSGGAYTTWQMITDGITKSTLAAQAVSW